MILIFIAYNHTSWQLYENESFYIAIKVATLLGTGKPEAIC